MLRSVYLCKFNLLTYKCMNDTKFHMRREHWQWIIMLNILITCDSNFNLIYTCYITHVSSKRKIKVLFRWDNYGKKCWSSLLKQTYGK